MYVSIRLLQISRACEKKLIVFVCSTVRAILYYITKLIDNILNIIVLLLCPNEWEAMFIYMFYLAILQTTHGSVSFRHSYRPWTDTANPNRTNMFWYSDCDRQVFKYRVNTFVDAIWNLFRKLNLKCHRRRMFTEVVFS